MRICSCPENQPVLHRTDTSFHRRIGTPHPPAAHPIASFTSAGIPPPARRFNRGPPPFVCRPGQAIHHGYHGRKGEPGANRPMAAVLFGVGGFLVCRAAQHRLPRIFRIGRILPMDGTQPEYGSSCILDALHIAAGLAQGFFLLPKRHSFPHLLDLTILPDVPIRRLKTHFPEYKFRRSITQPSINSDVDS